jgi:hypothetical protein
MRQGLISGIFIVIIFALISMFMGLIAFLYNKWVARQIVR